MVGDFAVEVDWVKALGGWVDVRWYMTGEGKGIGWDSGSPLGPLFAGFWVELVVCVVFGVPALFAERWSDSSRTVVL